MSYNPFEQSNAARYIPGLESSSAWLRKQFQKEGTIAPNVPGLLPAAQTVRDAFNQPANVANYIPGLVPASKALRGVFNSQKPGQSSDDLPGKGRMANLGPDYKQQELDAGKKAEDFRPGAGFPGQQSTGRTTAAPDGSGAKGTQTSPRQMTMDEANSLLTGGYKVQNPFSSTQLPDTSGSPYFGNGDTPEYRSDVPEDTYDVELASDMTTGSPFKQGDYKYVVPANTNIDYLQTSGAALLQTGGVVKASQNTESATEHPKSNIPKRPRGERAGAAWDRKYGRMNQQPEPTESKSPNIDYARRAAFLDAPNSMQGLRRVEAQKGMVYAGGQHNMVNPNAGKDGQSDFIKVEKSDRDAYMGNRMTAKELKDKYVKQIGDDGKTIPEPRVNYSFDSPDVEDPDDSIKGTMDDLPKDWK